MDNNEKYFFEKETIDGKEFLKLGRSVDFFEKKGKKFVFGDNVEEQIAVLRFEKKLYALSNICPHRHQDQIHNGFLENGNVICPAHGWTYSLETGDNVNFKQGIRRLKKFNIIEQDGFVFLEKPEFEVPLWKINLTND